MPSPYLADRQAVTAPAPVPPRYGLLFCAQQIMRELDLYEAPNGIGMAEGIPGTQASQGIRWQGSIEWAPETTLGGGIAAETCAGDTASLDVGTNPATTTADPFVVWAEDHCSTLGWRGRDFEGRAVRQLEATQSFRIASELWTGTLAQAASLDNEWLTDDPDVLTGAAVSADDAMAIVDMGLGRMLGGRRGMIHVTVQTLDTLQSGRSIIQSGSLWLTSMGNIVVADAGYPGTGPDGAPGTNQWIYGTPMIVYRLDDIFIVPNSFESAQAIARATDRSVNTITLRAERLALLQWDWKTPIGGSGETGVVGAETTIPAFAAL